MTPNPVSAPTLYVGLDIAKAKFDVCLLAPEGKPRKAVFSNNPSGFAAFMDWLRPWKGAVHAALEATGHYWVAVAEFLHSAGIALSVLNPAHVHAYSQVLGRRTKTDPADAEVIAR